MKKIRLGMFGVNRGSAYYDIVRANEGELVAICEKDEERCQQAKEYWGENLAIYDNFDEFIKHDLDAVFICNYFHEHAPYAIKCIEKGIPVLSECTAAGTIAEAVELVRAVEKYKTIYMLAENYPYMLFNQEMRRIYRKGELGTLLFAEGEYNHPANKLDPNPEKTAKTLHPFLEHWRYHLPRTYYLTHSLAPLMWITGVRPTKVTAMPIYKPEVNGGPYVGDIGAAMLITNDDNSVFRVFGHASFGFREDSYRIVGTKGQIENIRGGGNKVALNFNLWDIPEGKQENNIYLPEWGSEWEDVDIETLKKYGHGGSDYFTIHEFFKCIRENCQPEMDVYFATSMSVAGILAFRSILENKPFDIPNMKDESERSKFENDRETPFYSSDGGVPTIRCCSNPDHGKNNK
ncbi:MAG: Gfo/Idh/MocA family oxidoreductase [Clostridiales bacterium]|nr:Gfo/Idh/MocA family oxidoreductase [Clostridiales bacterium]MBE5754765.1 Gfo/Idh/MocA family oxidoreductase [Clostridiales bacterium]